MSVVRASDDDDDDEIYHVTTPRDGTKYELKLHMNTEVWFEEGLVHSAEGSDEPTEYTGCTIWAAALILSRW